MAWVDLGDLYVKKAGDNVTGSIVMANNNLSVAYDADTTYNVGTEIKSLRDSVSQITNALSSKVFNEMTIEADRMGNIVTLHVQGQNVLTMPETNIKIAELNCTPPISVRSLIGVSDNGSWLLLVVNPNDKNVYLHQRYGASNVTWSLVDISCSFIVAAH